MNWNNLVAKVQPYIVKIETPAGHGTGFLCFYNADSTVVGIATANHVVRYADDWQQPIRLRHYPTKTTIFLKEQDRAIFADQNSDSAIILTQPGDLELPKSTIPLLPATSPLAIGTEVGWLGFPAVAPGTLCFFSGNVSAREDGLHAYFIDGVAINGVSGGPVIYGTEIDGVQFVGTISAYISNKATGETLPGLSVARDVAHFHDIVSFIKNLDEAKSKKQEQQSTQPATLPDQETPARPVPNAETPITPVDPKIPEAEG